jgi:hypothetical protein
MITYLLGSFLFDNFILIFVVVILLLSFDFWTVKNVSGRKLVGLRWWNDVKEDGTSSWIFESKNPGEMQKISPTDSRVFWYSMYITTALWIVLAVGNLITLKISYLVLVLAAVALNSANLTGYIRCEKEYKKRAKEMQQQQAVTMGSDIATGLFDNAMGKVMGAALTRGIPNMK